MQTALKLLFPQLKRESATKWLRLLALLVQRDLRVRYRSSVLGYLWSMMNPMLYMVILSFVFSHLMKFNLPHYSIFILTGILTWNLFAQSLALGTSCIVANGPLLRKVRVPVTVFPAASVCSCLVNFALALVPLTIIGVAIGLHFTVWAAFVPLIVAPFAVFVFGVALTLASLNVTFRDIGHSLEPILQMLFYASPVVYPMESLPETYRKIAWLNPMAHFITEMRAVLYYGTPPHPTRLVLLYVMALIALAVGLGVYRKLRSGFVYHV